MFIGPYTRTSWNKNPSRVQLDDATQVSDRTSLETQYSYWTTSAYWDLKL